MAKQAPTHRCVKCSQEWADPAKNPRKCKNPNCKAEGSVVRLDAIGAADAEVPRSAEEAPAVRPASGNRQAQRMAAPSAASPVVVNVSAAMPEALAARRSASPRLVAAALGLAAAVGVGWFVWGQQSPSAEGPGGTSAASVTPAAGIRPAVLTHLPRTAPAAGGATDVSLDELRAIALQSSAAGSPPPERYGRDVLTFHAQLRGIHSGWAVFDGRPGAYCQLRPQTRLWREQPGATVAVRGRLTSLASNHVRFTDCRLSEEGD